MRSRDTGSTWSCDSLRFSGNNGSSSSSRRSALGMGNVVEGCRLGTVQDKVDKQVEEVDKGKDKDKEGFGCAELDRVNGDESDRGNGDGIDCGIDCEIHRMEAVLGQMSPSFC